MSTDLAVLESEMDRINAKLQSTYSYYPVICNKVKDVILSYIREKGKAKDEKLKFNVDEVKEIGGLLVHENAYSYITYLNQNTFNDVIFGLRKRKLIESPYFNVPRQKLRKLFAIFKGIEYKELLLILAINHELKTFGVGIPGVSAEDALLCSIVASLGLHGAMVYDGVYKDFLHLKYKDLDFDSPSMNIRWSDAKEGMHKSLFYRYGIPKITMSYFLQFFLLKQNKTHFRQITDKEQYVFPEHTRGIGARFNSLFKTWAEGIAQRNDLSVSLDWKRFNDVCKPYLAMVYPIALLSVQTRTLTADSLDMFYFAPLLNIDRSVFIDEIKPFVKEKIEQKKDYRRIITDDKELVKTIITISGILGAEVKNAKEKKNKAAAKKAAITKIRAEMTTLVDKRQEESGQLSPSIHNYTIYWEWILLLLSEKKNTISSVSTYTGSIGRYFLPLLRDANILECPIDEMEEKALIFGNWYLKKNEVRKKLKRFFSFISYAHGKKDFPKLSQLRSSRKVVFEPHSFMHFTDIEKALAETQDTLLRCAIILGFYAGLRAGEIANLKLTDLYYDGGYVLNIKTTKTKNGKRNIPLYLIMPDEHLKEIVQYYKKRLKENESDRKRTKKEGKWFFGKNKHDRNSSKMASRVGKLFEKSMGVNIIFHDLRHSFANWFLIRAYAAVYEKELFDPQPFSFQNLLFTDQYLERLKFLLWGGNFAETGRSNFSHILAALARLIGHGSPETTIKTYIHTIDFIMRIYLKEKYSNMKVKVSSKQLSELLQVSYLTLPAKFKGKGRKTLNVKDIVETQKALLKLPTSRQFRAA